MKKHHKTRCLNGRNGFLMCSQLLKYLEKSKGNSRFRSSTYISALGNPLLLHELSTVFSSLENEMEHPSWFSRWFIDFLDGEKRKSSQQLHLNRESRTSSWKQYPRLEKSEMISKPHRESLVSLLQEFTKVRKNLNCSSLVPYNWPECPLSTLKRVKNHYFAGFNSKNLQFSCF